MLRPRNRDASRGRRQIVAPAIGLAALLSIFAVGPESASAFGDWPDVHERITRNAFPFMRGDILRIVIDGNLDEDEGDAEDLTERHGQNCRFRDSAAYANMRYRQIVEALLRPSASDPNRAARLFGHIMHGIQDFYSHSNWVGTPPEGLGIRGRLLDSGLGFWPLPVPYSILFDDVMIIEGDPPADVTVRLPTDAAGRVSSAVPIVIDRRMVVHPGPLVAERRIVTRRSNVADQPLATVAPAVADRPSAPVRPKGGLDEAFARQFRGLMTSVSGDHVDSSNQFCPPVGDDCKTDSPDNVCLRHGETRDSGEADDHAFEGEGHMNFDHDGGGDWFEARHLARRQSMHEWCRLLHLSRDLDPSFEAAAVLLATWVKTDSGTTTPHLPATACARGVAKRHLVEVSVTTEGGAPFQASFVLFRGDFTSSARANVGRGSTKKLSICANANDKVAATVMRSEVRGPALVVPEVRGPTLVVEVPDVAKTWTVRDHRGAFGAKFSITVRPNAC